ncbi:MAG: ABC transporter ATP-binding protein [Pseudomonadota bacterium]
MRSSSVNPDSHDVAIALNGITKRFPGVVANDRISLTFRRGEVHALLGENGAGKSTLIAIMSGMQRPDSGQIQVAGRSVRITSPSAALRLGIGTVYQHVLLVPSLTVLENLMLGAPWWRPCNRTATLKRFEELSALLSTNVAPDSLVGRLSLGQQQQVEIMRALWHGELVLILDEPTSMLTPQGVAELGVVVRRLRDHGVAVVFITHKLKEAYDLADRVSVLRLGRVVGELGPEDLRAKSELEAIDAVVAMMFGREEEPEDLKTTLLGGARERDGLSVAERSGEPALSMRGCHSHGDPGECPLAGVDLDVWPGEILGIAGVDGNGQKHFAEALAGQRRLSAGSILLGGEAVERTDVIQRRARGVRYITDERLGEGTAARHSVATNLILKEIGKSAFWRHGLTQWRQINEHGRKMIAEHDIRAPSERTTIEKLSGGNIQKVLLAREWAPDASLVIFNKPTYGLDLQTTKRARDWIKSGAGAPGAVIIVISNELDELIEVCHRIAVIDRGRIAGVVDAGDGATSEIGRLMTGAEAA